MKENLLRLYILRICHYVKKGQLRKCTNITKTEIVKTRDVGLGGLRVTYSPRDPRFGGSDPAEVEGFF